MANPVSIVQAIIDLALKIKKEVETFRHNREDCRKIGELVATVRAVAEGLRMTMEKEDGGALVGGALKSLKQALERAWDLVVSCQRKNAVFRALDADAIAEKLRRVYLDVSLNLSAVVLANGAYNTSKLADIYAIVATLRAEVAHNTRMLAKIREIVAALPEHLRQEVARLLQSYSDSTEEDASYYQNASTKETKKAETKQIETKKTDGVASYYQNESTRETKKAETKKTDDVVSYYKKQSTMETEKTQTKKTDDVARTYSSPSSYAYYPFCYVDCSPAQVYVPSYGSVPSSLGGGATTREFTTNVYPAQGYVPSYGSIPTSLGGGATAREFTKNVYPAQGYVPRYGSIPSSLGGGATAAQEYAPSYGSIPSSLGGGATAAQEYAPSYGSVPSSLVWEDKCNRTP